MNGPIFHYEIPAGTYHVEFRIGDYVIDMKLMRSPTGHPLGDLSVHNLHASECTEIFVQTDGKKIPATPQNLKNLMTLIVNHQAQKEGKC